MIIFCLVLILPNFLSPELAITKLLNNIGFTGTLAVILVILSLTNDGEGGKMFNFVESLKVGMPYGMVMLVATALQVSSKLTDASTGVAEALACYMFASVEPLTISSVGNVKDPGFDNGSLSRSKSI